MVDDLLRSTGERQHQRLLPRRLMPYNWTEQHQHDRARTDAAVSIRGSDKCAGRAIDCGSDTDDHSGSALARRTLRMTEHRRSSHHCDSYGDQEQSI